MTSKLTLDKAGRLVLPKPLRDQMQLGPGTVLEMEAEGEQIILRPIRPKATLVKEMGIWVYQGDSSQAGLSDFSIVDFIDSEREKRLREFM